jgi:tetratricopeptide (TPR) repeat protein
MPLPLPPRRALRQLAWAAACALGLQAAACALGLQAAAAQGAAPAEVNNSALDARLFYQLLISEVQLASGDPGSAYELTLDAARSQKSEQLFRRATDIALQARAGDQALAAARAWRTAFPKSADAHRYLVQLLVSLGRPAESVAPLRSLIELTPAAERAALVSAVPGFYARSPNRKEAATWVQEAVQSQMDEPLTRAAARVSVGVAKLSAGEPQAALELAQRAQTLDPAAPEPALLALDLLARGTGAAEALVSQHLRTVPTSAPVRMAYARVLTGANRYPDALAQLDAVARAEPKHPQVWLTLGALHLELRQPAIARTDLERHLALLDEADGRASSAAAAPANADDDGEDDTPSTAAAAAGRSKPRTTALLLLAQAAEQQKDYAGAEQVLSRIEPVGNEVLDVQSRRASLLARQGKLPEARALIHNTPLTAPALTQNRLLAEVQLLREYKQWGEAHDLLVEALLESPRDTDLLYEQSTIAEKLGNLVEMEALLRQVMAIQPEHHNAYNALGYSLADRNQRLPEARELIAKALQLAPGEPFITDSMGWVEYRLGHTDEALRLLGTAYRARPDTEIGAHFGEVLWVSGRRNEALGVFRAARERDAANEVLQETLARLKVGL